jgi:hypothetical protein
MSAPFGSLSESERQQVIRNTLDAVEKEVWSVQASITARTSPFAVITEMRAAIQRQRDALK